MTNEQTNIKIDVLLGGEKSGIAPRSRYYPKTGYVGWLPNYATDLNACHEFEKTLTPKQQKHYLTLLMLDGNAFMATARQRCEAFLRVHGQWEETE